METLIFDAYTAFLDLIGEALPDLTVYDGPQVGAPDDDTYIVFGTADPRVDGPVVSVESPVQDWDSLGAYSRMETFVLVATIVVTSGDADYQQLRDTAKACVTAIGQALRPPPHGTGDAMLNGTLNQEGNGTGWCGMAVTGLTQGPVSNGIAVYVPIALACTARI